MSHSYLTKKKDSTRNATVKLMKEYINSTYKHKVVQVEVQINSLSDQ